MGGLIRALEKRYSVLTGASLESPSNWALRVFGAGQNTAAGVDVTEQTALRSIDVLTCVKIISETIAQLPLITYKRLATGGKKRATNHPLYSVLHDRANDEMTAFILKETLQAHLLTWGNAYAEIERNDVGDCVGLFPLLPDRTGPLRRNGVLYYYSQTKRDVADPGIQRIIPARDVFHLAGLGFDGLKGYSVIEMIREQIGLTQAQEEYAGRFYSNGSMPPAYMTYAKSLSLDDIKRLQAEWDDGRKGVRNAWKMALLDNGMDIKVLGINQQDAQFIEQRRFSSEKIAGFFRVPPDMVTSSDKAGPYGVGIEQRQIGFAKFTIQPWAVRWESAINAKLLLRPRDDAYFAEFLMDGLERADMDKRYSAYAVGFGKWLTADEIRNKENLNPYEAPEDPNDIGKVLIWPLNMGSASAVAEAGPSTGVALALPSGQANPSSPPAGTGMPSRDGEAASSRRALAKAESLALTDALDRVLRREATDILARSRKRSNPTDWLDAFYDEHRVFVGRQVEPHLRAYAAMIGAEVSRELERAAAVPETFLRKYVAGYAARHVAASQGEARILLAGPRQDAESAIDHWPARAEWAATREANQAGNAFALAAYRDAGVVSVRWDAGDDCADCRALQGREIGIETKFAQRGELTDDKYVPAAGLGHPPLCDGCDCVVMATI